MRDTVRWTSETPARPVSRPLGLAVGVSLAAAVFLTMAPAVWLVGLPGTAQAQLRDDATSSTRGTQFVKPPPKPEPPPAPAAVAPPKPPAPPAPAAVEPPKPPPAQPPPPRYPSVVFLLDTSDSMLNRVAPGAERTRMDEARDALVHVLNRMAADTRVQVWAFNTRMVPLLVPGVPQGAFVAIGRPGSRQALIAQVRQARTDGGTNLYQSVIRALRLFAQPRDQAAYGSGERFPVLVVLSDGEDGGKTRETLADVQQAKAALPLVTVNTIGFKIGDDAAWFQVLCRIATRPDGCAGADDEARLRALLDGFYRFRQAR